MNVLVFLAVVFTLFAARGNFESPHGRAHFFFAVLAAATFWALVIE